MSFSNSLLSVSLLSTISSACWWSLYKKFRRSYKWEQEFTSRVVAAIHAVIVVIFSFFCIKYGPDPLYLPGEPNTNAQIVTIYVSLGYFIHDFFWCVKHQPEPKIMLFHHLASIAAMFYILYIGSSGSEAVGGLCSLEFTNPILQARWFLRTMGKADTLIYRIVEVSFCILFLVIRIGYGSFLVMSVVGSEKSALPVKICTILLYIISLAFIYSIGRFVVRKLTKKAKVEGEAEEEEDDDVKLS